MTKGALFAYTSFDVFSAVATQVVCIWLAFPHTVGLDHLRTNSALVISLSFRHFQILLIHLKQLDVGPG